MIAPINWEEARWFLDFLSSYCTNSTSISAYSKRLSAESPVTLDYGRRAMSSVDIEQVPQPERDRAMQFLQYQRSPGWGRNSKDDEAKKVRVVLYFDPADADSLNQKASDAGLGLSQYIRLMCGV